MALARISQALKESNTRSVLMPPVTEKWTRLLRKLFGFRSFTQLSITFYFLFPRWWFYWRTPPNKRTWPSPADHPPAEIAAICHRPTVNMWSDGGRNSAQSCPTQSPMWWGRTQPPTILGWIWASHPLMNKHDRIKESKKQSFDVLGVRISAILISSTLLRHTPQFLKHLLHLSTQTNIKATSSRLLTAGTKGARNNNTE